MTLLSRIAMMKKAMTLRETRAANSLRGLIQRSQVTRGPVLPLKISEVKCRV